MKNILIVILSLFTVTTLFSAVTDPNTGWTYIQSSNQTFYFFIDYINIIAEDGSEIEGYGDGTNPSTSSTSDCVLEPSSCDVLGAFLSHDDVDMATCTDIGGYFENGVCDVCVGWIYYNSYTENPSNGSVTTTLLVNGYDTSSNGDYDYYCQNADIPHLKFYDASEEFIYSLTSNIELGEFFNNNLVVYYPDCSETSDPDCLELILNVDSSQSLDNSESLGIPNSFDIIGIYPNPFNPSTTVSYTLNVMENINITVFDTLGNQIQTLFDGYQEVGAHEVSWVPSSSVASGTYFIKINTSNDYIINKVTFLK